LEYNYKSKKLTGILDRLINPFNSINKLILDKYNRFLFIQEGTNITIFDLLTKKELITFPGLMDEIDQQNLLHLNLYANYTFQGKDKYGQPQKIISNVFDDLLNVNELYKTESFKYLNNIDKFDIDEFMTKEEFQKKTNIYQNKQLSIFSENTFSENITMPYNETKNLPNDKIIAKINNSILNHIKSINENLLTDSLQLNLTYDNYSFDKKSISLKLNLNEINLVEPFNGFEGKFSNNIDFDLEGQKVKLKIEFISCNADNYCSVEISGIEPEIAKNIKNGSISSSIILSSLKEANSSIPNYESTFILENKNINSYFEQASSSFLHHKYNVLNLKLGDKIKPISIINLIEINKQTLEEDSEYTINIIEKDTEN